MRIRRTDAAEPPPLRLAFSASPEELRKREARRQSMLRHPAGRKATEPPAPHLRAV